MKSQLHKYALALNTTGPELGLGLSNFKDVLRYQSWRLERNLSTHLHLHLTEFILPQTWFDLEWITVAKGPGSFTGSRIGVVTARTLAQQLHIPLFPISTLAALAWTQAAKSVEINLSNPIAVEIPAQRGQIYGAIYQVSSANLELIPVVPDKAMTVDQWQNILAEWPTPYQRVHTDETSLAAVVTCKAILELAFNQWQRGDRPCWSEALPFYGQEIQPS